MIGFMSARSPDDTGLVLQAFLKGLGEAGFFDGQNVTIEYRWARGDYSRLPAFAAEFVQRRVNVLAATGGEAIGRSSEASYLDDPDRVCGG